MRRQIADCKTDPSKLTVIRLRTVHQQHVMQRHLTRLEHDVNGSRFVDFDGDFLTAAQQIIRCKGIFMRKLLNMCVPGTTRMQPFALVLAVNATHAVAMSGDDSPQ